MASSGRPTYHQDYIARIRYSNALPPPPCPPKLLEIPNTGLASGEYTSAGFASRLHREQPLNTEADAELGMPIDLVGIKGVFDGDESAINLPDVIEPPHPHDRALLRPLAALGKPTTIAGGVSFLRRTEYITSHTAGGSRFESSNSGNTMRIRGKRRRGETSQDDPINIVRHITKGFDIAYPQDAYTGPDTDSQIRGADISVEEKKAWKTPIHPSKENVRLLDSYPILPDLDALPDTGSYIMYKFVVPPVQDPQGRYDERLDVAMLRPNGEAPEDQENYKIAEAANEADPVNNPIPIPKYQYEFFLPAHKERVDSIRRDFASYTEEEVEFDPDAQQFDKPAFKYNHVRMYETSYQSGDPSDTWGDVVAMALHDEDARQPKRRKTKLQKAAYIYPIIQRTSIRPRRQAAKKLGYSQEDEGGDKVDIVEARGRDPDEEVEKRAEAKARYDVQA